MAGDWIKLETTTIDKPEVHGIAAQLNISVETAIGHLLRIWVWVDQNSIDGSALKGSKTTLDAIARLEGFADAMEKEGWLKVSDGVMSLPNFDRLNGQTAKQRALTARRVANHKARTGNDEVTPPTLPREEKSREEKSKRNTNPMRFEEFWTVWPAHVRKGAKGRCEEVWSKGGFDLEADAIIAHVKAMTYDPGWTKQGGEFMPAPLAYLNQRRWEGAEAMPVAQDPDFAAFRGKKIAG